LGQRSIVQERLAFDDLGPSDGSSRALANASGVVYQQANALTSGNVTIHR
jgi:hypothetical protein